MTNDKATKDILWFEELGMGDVPLVGGKNASLGEMMPVVIGAFGVWGIPAGFLLAVLGNSVAGAALLVAGSGLVAMGHGLFWAGALGQDLRRGLLSIPVTFLDLLLVIPASVAALLKLLTGKRY